MMRFFSKIKNFIFNIFRKKQEIKMLAEPCDEVIQNNQREAFIDSLKIKANKRKNGKIEIPICYGDGMGICNKIEY